MNFFILIEGLLKIPFTPRDEGSGVLPPTEVVSCRATSARFEPAEGVGGFGAVVIDIDEQTGKARSILRLREWAVTPEVLL